MSVKLLKSTKHRSLVQWLTDDASRSFHPCVVLKAFFLFWGCGGEPGGHIKSNGCCSSLCANVTAATLTATFFDHSISCILFCLLFLCLVLMCIEDPFKSRRVYLLGTSETIFLDTFLRPSSLWLLLQFKSFALFCGLRWSRAQWSCLGLSLWLVWSK